MRHFSIAFISAVLLISSFPKFDLGFLAWVSLVPFLLALHGRNYLKNFFVALLCGSLFWAGLAYWLIHVPKYTLLHCLILMPYLGFSIGLFGLMFSFVNKRWGVIPALIATPFIWVAMEFAKSHFFWLSLPWGMLAHSQYQYLPVIQIASYTGAYGISFLIVLVNSAIALMVVALSSRLKGFIRINREFPSKKAAIIMASTTAILVVSTFIYGWAILSTPISGDSVKISLVQANIDQNKKWDRKFAGSIMRTYAALTQQAAKDRPALIAWPETATPRAITRDPRYFLQVKRIAAMASTPLLLGSAQRRKYGKEGFKKKIDYTNSAFLIQTAGASVKNQRYDKIKLLPFGEYLPAKKSIPWRLINIEAVRGYTAGKEYTVLELPPYRFSAPICWEIIFPNIVRQFVKEGAQFIVNITNAAFFGKSAAPYQVLSMTVFRAVENRVYVVVAANTGISCFIDTHGRIVDRVKNEKGEDLFVQGVLSGTVIPQDSKTFYTLYGDVFAWLCVMVSTVIVLLCIFRRCKEYD